MKKLMSITILAVLVAGCSRDPEAELRKLMSESIDRRVAGQEPDEGMREKLEAFRKELGDERAAQIAIEVMEEKAKANPELVPAVESAKRAAQRVREANDRRKAEGLPPQPPRTR